MSLTAASPHHVWVYDFMEDHAVNGSCLRVLTVMDEFTREGLEIDVATTTSADWVIHRLAQLVATHGAPAYLRSDNGPEFVAIAVQPWLAQRQIGTLYIDPGCPWQNGKEERFNGTVRDECLNMDVFRTVTEARVRVHAFRQHYNTERPHSALGYQTPSEFKQAWIAAQEYGDDPARAFQCSYNNHRIVASKCADAQRRPSGTYRKPRQRNTLIVVLRTHAST
jgi:putative transposase